MAVSLQKGQKINLTKDNTGLSKIMVALGWDEIGASKGSFGKIFQSSDMDCDASVILLRNGKFQAREDLVYFGNLRHKSGAIVHQGDNLTGGGEGDDEQIMIDLSQVPKDVDRLIFVVNIYEAQQRHQHFGMVKNAFIRVVDQRNNKELARYNLTDDCSNMTALIFGEVYRHDGEWKFSAIGQPTQDKSLSEILNRFK